MNTDNILKKKEDNSIFDVPIIKIDDVITNYNSKNKDQVQYPNAFIYHDNSGNTIIVYNHVISIQSKNYKNLNKGFFTCPDLTKIFANTDFQVADSILPLIFTKETLKIENFSTLKENFTSLREGLVSLREGLVQYCKPADSSNGSKIATTTINEFQQNNENSILLNDITMIFIMIIVFITMCVVSPMMYLEMNKLTGYNVFILWGLRILSGIIFFIGGIISIIAARTPDAPSWLAILGMIMIMSYGLFYIVVFVFQKNVVITQLTNAMQEEVEPIKGKIQRFILNQFGAI